MHAGQPCLKLYHVTESRSLPAFLAAAQDEGVGLGEAVRAAAGGRAVPAAAAQARGAAAQDARRLLRAGWELRV